MNKSFKLILGGATVLLNAAAYFVTHDAVYLSFAALVTLSIIDTK